jgi:hypothetical protein
MYARFPLSDCGHVGACFCTQGAGALCMYDRTGESHMAVLMPLFRGVRWDHDSAGRARFKPELRNNNAGPRAALWRRQRLHSEAQFVNVTMAFVAFPDVVLCVFYRCCCYNAAWSDGLWDMEPFGAPEG